MANQLAQFDPVGRFQGARQNALAIKRQEEDIDRRPLRNELAQIGLQQARTGVARQTAGFERDDAIRNATALGRAAKVLLSVQDPDARAQLTSQFIEPLENIGVSAEDLDLLISDEGQGDERLRQIVMVMNALVQDPANLTSEQRNFQGKIQRLGTATGDELKAIRIDLGLAPREAGAAAKTILIGGVPHIFDPNTKKFTRAEVEGAPVTTETVGKSKAEIAKQVKLAEARAAQSIKISGEAFANLQRIRANILNLDKGIALLDQGAGVGPVEDLFPSFKAATVELKNLQGQLGLDVIGGTTFGALSESELAFALKVALPTGLDTPDLRRWMVAKQQAQGKLMIEFAEAAEFLGKGNDIADFIALKELGQVEKDQNNVQVDF